jgi:type VI protein secretion system component VasK
LLLSFFCHCAGLSDRATAARQRLLQHQQAQALSQAPSLSGLLFGSQQTQQTQRQTQSGFGSAPGADGDQRLPLAVRLKVPADGAADGSLLPTQLLRKYIAYAREHVHPVLSDEAKDILQVGVGVACVGRWQT